MKNYRVRVETNDGCVTTWYEKSKAKSAHLLINNRVYNQLCGLNIKEVSVTLSVWIMNYTLQQLRDRVNKLIEQQGEDAYCAAWVFTAENCIVYYEDTEEYHFVAEGNSELAERILSNVCDDDHIFQEIQALVDEVTEEQYMLYQQELV